MAKADKKEPTEADFRSHSKYMGGGYFIHPDARPGSPSLFVIHAPEMYAGLLALLDAERAAHAETEAALALLRKDYR